MAMSQTIVIHHSRIYIIDRFIEVQHPTNSLRYMESTGAAVESNPMP